MTDKIDKKKVDIYSLYKKEKLVRIEDDENNYIEILLVKMTQGERLETFKSYNTYLEEQRIQLREREGKFHSLALAIEQYKQADFINGIVVFESAQRNEIADLYPLLEGKTEEEKKKIIEEEAEKFRKIRTSELEKLSAEELKQKFIDLTIESQSLLDAVRILHYQSLVYMCLDPETKQKLFNSISDIEKICDRRVIDTLIEEMTAFRSLEASKEVRKVASEDPNFLQHGQSQES